ncbi:MAG: hypothetical protein ACPGVO_21435 [Spirulinaceae cyanobacterium]
MEKQLVNVTLLLVQTDIEPILAEQPLAVQNHFRAQNLYAELAAYVLSRIPNHHVVLPNSKAQNPQLGDLKPYLLQESAERQLCRERFICEGIYWVLEKGSTSTQPCDRRRPRTTEFSDRTPFNTLRVSRSR